MNAQALSGGSESGDPQVAAAPGPDWTAALALAAPGRRYRISHVVAGHLRGECRQLGLDEGAEVVCLSNARRSIGLVASTGRQINVEREAAWFIRVEAA
jgi:hypothetical protein